MAPGPPGRWQGAARRRQTGSPMALHREAYGREVGSTQILQARPMGGRGRESRGHRPWKDLGATREQRKPGAADNWFQRKKP